MENTPKTDSGDTQKKGFALFAAKRILLVAVGVALLIWLVGYALDFFNASGSRTTGHTSQVADETGHPDTARPAGDENAAAHDQDTAHEAAAAAHTDGQEHASTAQTDDGHGPSETEVTAEHGAPGATNDETHAASGHDTPAAADDETHAAAGHGAPAAADDETHAATGHGAAAGADHGAHEAAGHVTVTPSKIRGVTFVKATIAPLEYELNHRWYGWRPNDIIRPTDNVHNFQLGVLEVTRRTAEVLTEHISRTGSTQSFDKDLEQARNKLMINADDYMLPSAEASYEDALEALANYRQKLEEGSAPFYTRTDNLIPLLAAYENLLGSCDDNLVKYKEDDGSDVSWFQADNYFYYAQGVASAMHTILQAIAIDFAATVETRRGSDVLHHAIEALHHATVIQPWIILDGDPDGFTANHRANLAGPISHARFYIGLLVEALST